MEYATMAVRKEKPSQKRGELTDIKDIFLAVHENDLSSAFNILRINPHAIAALNWRGCTPLHVAVEGGNLSMVKLLLAQPAVDATKKDNMGFDPLDVAIRLRHQPLIIDELFRFRATQLGLMGEEEASASQKKTHIYPIKPTKPSP
jgi:hypothetical protein